MSDQESRAAGEIDTLLGTRQRISEWLHRLGHAPGDVPVAVRDRVRSDYQGRLTKVVEELRGHSAAISSNLDGLRRDKGERLKVRSVEEESLAEAKLRHAVGEYGDEEWHAHEERSGTRLESLGAEIHHLLGEIGRLEEVLVQITGAPSTPAVIPSAPVAAIEADENASMPSPSEAEGHAYQLGDETFITLDEGPGNPRTQSIFDRPGTAEHQVVEAGSEPELMAPEAPRFTPRSGAIPPRPRQASRPVEDEMAFLKSVVSEPASPRSASAEKRGLATAAAAVATKTLKCQDCGTLNRPTEWYCERCGAELSAV
ncbi:MAG: hypothetical protein SGI84_10465 [Gemmatimonadota bacterium]|nr:hypothetical protein [Gemmatimonadota bacterium]